MYYGGVSLSKRTRITLYVYPNMDTVHALYACTYMILVGLCIIATSRPETLLTFVARYRFDPKTDMYMIDPQSEMHTVHVCMYLLCYI